MNQKFDVLENNPKYGLAKQAKFIKIGEGEQFADKNLIINLLNGEKLRLFIKNAKSKAKDSSTKQSNAQTVRNTSSRPKHSWPGRKTSSKT